MILSRFSERLPQLFSTSVIVFDRPRSLMQASHRQGLKIKPDHKRNAVFPRILVFFYRFSKSSYWALVRKVCCDMEPTLFNRALYATDVRWEGEGKRIENSEALRGHLGCKAVATCNWGHWTRTISWTNFRSTAFPLSDMVSVESS